MGYGPIYRGTAPNLALIREEFDILRAKVRSLAESRVAATPLVIIQVV